MSTEGHTSGGDRLHWFKSSYSGSDGGDCVEVAMTARTVGVRDSKDATRRGLGVSPTSWSAFVAHVGR